MAEIDSLEIKIGADAARASQAIDKLVKNIESLASSLKSVNTSAMSTAAKSLSQNLSNINGKGFSELNKSAKEADGNVKKISQTAKKVTKSLSEINEKYKDLGKEFELKGSTKYIEKQIDRLTNKLTEAKLAKDDFEKSEKTNLGGYETAVKNVIKYTNQIKSLKNQLKLTKEIKPELEVNVNGPEKTRKNIDEYKKELSDFKSEMEKMAKSVGGMQNVPLAVPLGNLKQTLEEIKNTYPQATNVISSFEKEIINLENESSKLTKEPAKPKIETGQVENKTKEINREMNELGKKLSNLVVPPVQEDNIIKLESTLKRLESNIDNLQAKLKNEITMGNITASTDDKGYVELRKKISFIQKQAEAVREKIEITIDEKDAFRKIDSLKNKVDELKKKLKELKAQGLSSGNAKFDETYKQLNKANDDLKKYKNNLDKAGGSGGTFADRMRNALSDVNSSSSRTGNAMRSLSNSVKKAFNAMKSSSVSTAGLARNLGLLYAKIHIITRLGRSLFKSIGSAQDYIEEFNYFSVALDKIGKDSASQFKEAGYNSAEEYAKSFRGRFAKLQKQMTGYEVDYDTGDAVSKMTHNLGLDLTEIMNFNAGIAQITNSAGMLGETSIMTSKALSMLSADWSSLANEDLSTTMEHLRSGLIGQSRAVYKYGIDITNAGLAQTAMNHGLDVSINKLSQQSKMQLRALTILEQSKVAYGDLAKTINQPANQLRMLQAGFKNLSRTIGSLFIPIVQQVYPYLNAIVMVLQEFVQWIAKTVGIKLGDISGGISAPDYSDLADDTDSAADNMDKVAKKTKKASDNLQGFDIINKLTKDESDKDDKDKGVKNIDLSKDLAAALKDYESIWDKAFKNNTNKAVQLAKKIKKALLDAWKTGDFYKIGAKLAEWINKGLAKIPWNKIKATIKKIAKSIATFLNGFIKGIDWTLVGKTIAEGLNTAVDGAYEFWTTFDWLAFGESLADGVKSFVEKFNAKKYGKLLGAKLRGVIQFAFGLLTNLPYKKIGKKFGDAINGFFEDMGEVRKNTGLTGWQELGQTISKSIVGILDTISVALATVKWEEVGKAIGQFLGNIEWGEILTKVGKVIVTALFTAIKIAFYAFKEDPAGVASALTAVFGAIFVYKKFKKLKTIFSALFGTGMKEGINDVSGLGSTFSERIGKLTGSTKVQKAFSNIGKVLGTIMAAQMVGMVVEGLGSSYIQKNLGKLWSGSKPDFGASVAISAKWVGSALQGDFKSLDEVEKEVEEQENKRKKENTKEKTKKITEKKKTEAEKYGISGSQFENLNKIVKEYIKGTSADIAKYESILDSNFKKTSKNRLFNLQNVQKSASLLSEKLTKGKISVGQYRIEINKLFKKLLSSNAINDFKNKMEKLGVSEKSQKEIVKKLTSAYGKGKISFDQYANTIRGKQKNIDGLELGLKNIGINIKNIKPKSVDVKVNTEGKDQVKEAKSAIDSMKDKNVTVKATADKNSIENALYKIPSSKKVKMKLEAGKLNIKKINVSDKVKESLSAGLSVGLKVKELFLPKTLINAGEAGAAVGLSVIKGLTKKGNGIKLYAKGGFPEDGWFRANRGEIMGRFDNGKSVVANNQQITDGIAQAVGPAVYAAVKSAMNENGGNGEPIVINLDGKKIAESTVSQVNSMTRQKGRSPLLVNI